MRGQEPPDLGPLADEHLGARSGRVGGSRRGRLLSSPAGPGDPRYRCGDRERTLNDDAPCGGVEGPATVASRLGCLHPPGWRSSAANQSFGVDGRVVRLGRVPLSARGRLRRRLRSPLAWGGGQLTQRPSGPEPADSSQHGLDTGPAADSPEERPLELRLEDQRGDGRNHERAAKHPREPRKQGSQFASVVEARSSSGLRCTIRTCGSATSCPPSRPGVRAQSPLRSPTRRVGPAGARRGRRPGRRPAPAARPRRWRRRSGGRRRSGPRSRA
jgi:hypothetical protein